MLMPLMIAHQNSVWNFRWVGIWIGIRFSQRLELRFLNFESSESLFGSKKRVWIPNLNTRQLLLIRQLVVEGAAIGLLVSHEQQFAFEKMAVKGLLVWALKFKTWSGQFHLDFMKLVPGVPSLLGRVFPDAAQSNLRARYCAGTLQGL